jgi:glucose-1-phosphate adenylyltransferase
MDPANVLRPLDVVAVIMGGGAGTRLFPLTKDRSKPAVPLGGKYRLVDIPISNCINSELRRIFVLTQFNSSSLHRHIQDAYRFDVFAWLRGDPGRAAAPDRVDWAGAPPMPCAEPRAPRNYPHKLVLILRGPAHRMDFRAVLEQHIAGADATVATIRGASRAGAFGIVQLAPTGHHSFRGSRRTAHCWMSCGSTGRDRPAARQRRGRLPPGVMGIYVFKRKSWKRPSGV